MDRIAKRISDKQILCLIRLYLQAGIMVYRIVQERHESTSQGGPLSPVISNILLMNCIRNWKDKGISSAATQMIATFMCDLSVPVRG